MTPRALHLLLALAAAVTSQAFAAAGDTPPSRAGYLRYPDLNGSQLVFVAGGDLWVTSDHGGASRRLTTHAGSEYFPKFSPDGRSIAFTGEYDGNQDVYVTPAEGGEPRRLTWHPGSDQVIGWTPDGRQILFRTSAEEPHGEYELFAVGATGGEPERMPLGWAARLAIEPGTNRWAFTRISTSESATWKRYRGGSSADIWVGDPQTGDYRKITDFKGPDAFPMWHGGRIYFLSDQGGTANLWSINPDGSDRRQHTDVQGWDARFPSVSPDGRIVFMLGGDIHLFDPGSGTEHGLTIDLPSERTLTRVRYPSPERDLTWFELAPDGERVVIGTRGELFSVPVKKEGVTLPISRGSGAREKWGSFDEKGERLVYVSDLSHEERVYSIDAWGRGEARPISPAKANGGWLFPPEYSPDGKWVAVGDQAQNLYLVPAAGGDMRTIDHSDFNEIRHYAWSPDGRWLAYEKPTQVDWSSIYIYDVRSAKSTRVTGVTTNDGWPCWDPDGRYLYFLGARTMNPVLGLVSDFSNVELRSMRPYLVLLKKDEKNPMAPLAGMPEDAKDKDKEKKEKSEDKDKDKKSDKDADEEKEKVEVTIDLEGIQDRIVELPADPGILSDLAATSEKLFYLSAPIRGMNDEGEGLFESGKPDNELMTFDLEEREEAEFLTEVGSFSLAPDAGKIAIMKEKGEIYVVDASEAPEELDEDAKVELKWIVVELDPREEWEQMFYEAWRHERDFYWDPGMAGLDWPAERDRYAKLLPRLTTRADLRDLLGEMIGELSTSHTYVWGGDQGVEPTKVTTGLLGAEVTRSGNFYQVKRIFRGDPADRQASPLLEPGVGVKEGDYLIAVDHRPFAADAPFLANFASLAKKPVVLTVNSKAAKEGARDVVVTPLDSRHPGAICGLGPPESGIRRPEDRRQDRVHPPSRHAASGAHRVRYLVLRPDRQGGAGGRRALEPGRLRVATGHRKAPPEAGELRSLAGRHHLYLSLSAPERAVRGPDQRVRRLGRRHLPDGDATRGAGAGDRHPLLGRSGGDSGRQAAGRRRHADRARVRLVGSEAGLGARESRRDPGHRARQPAGRGGEGDRRAARPRDRRGDGAPHPAPADQAGVRPGEGKVARRLPRRALMPVRGGKRSGSTSSPAGRNHAARGGRRAAGSRGDGCTHCRSLARAAVGAGREPLDRRRRGPVAGLARLRARCARGSR